MLYEIGSEFWDVPINTSCSQSELLNTATWFVSGRSALRAIIRRIKQDTSVKTAAIPSWCCDSMIIPFVKEGIEPRFYTVSYRNGLYQKLDCNCDVTLVMDYFGYENNDFEATGGIIIRDLTHNPFCNRHKDASYYFGSLRKWCGFYTGGFAYGVESIQSYNDEYVSLREEAMTQKKTFIDGKRDDKHYLLLFEQAEKMLESCEIFDGDKRDIVAANHLDIQKIIARRRQNAQQILNEFGDIAIFPEVGSNDCPMFVPILVKNRDELRKYLISERIYCPSHWPITKEHRISEATKQLYNEEISLVCDQRYTEDDMNRLITVLKRGIKLC